MRYLEDPYLNSILEDYFEESSNIDFKICKVKDESKDKIYDEYKKKIDDEINHLINKFLKIKLKKISKDNNHDERNDNYKGKQISYDQLVKSTNIYNIEIFDYEGYGDYDYILDVHINFNNYINDFWKDQSYILQSCIIIKKNGNIAFVNETEETT